jgi:hypothetical protein
MGNPEVRGGRALRAVPWKLRLAGGQPTSSLRMLSASFDQASGQLTIT